MPFALVTGASSGIGLHMAHELASRKYDLLLIARSEDKLKSIATELQDKFKVKVNYLTLDLSITGSSDKVIQWINQESFDIEVFINNAGFGIWGNLETNNAVELNQMMQLNMITLMELSNKIIPYFKNRKKKSYLLNVASTAAYQAVPAMAVYSASKSFVVQFTRALRWELKDSNMSVTCFSPGTTSTGFMNRAKMDDELKRKADKFTMPADTVARIGINGMFAGKAEVLPGFTNWISVKLVSFLPKYLAEKIAYDIYKQK